MRATILKYREVAWIGIRSRWVYIHEQLMSNLFLVIILFTFLQLWKTTYALGQKELIEGYSLKDMLWYLVFTEAIILSLPTLFNTISDEVKSGDIAIRLNKPYNYVLFHFFHNMGDNLIRFISVLSIGILTALVLVGSVDMIVNPLSLLGSGLIFMITFSLHFLFAFSIGLFSFWMEDVQGLFLVGDRMKWILGGMFLPLEIFPDLIASFAKWTPFPYMIYAPARLMLRFSWQEFWQVLSIQIIWLILFSLACGFLFKLGSRRLDVHGG